MAERKIVGWFYRNGKRIPIFEKSDNPKRSNIYQGKNVDELEANVEEGRGVKLDSADRNAIRYHGRDTNGERVSLYGETKTGMRKAETAMYNNYWDGDKELINFRRKADPGVLRHNVKAAGKSERASRVKDASFTTRVERDVMENPGDYGLLHHEPKKSSNIKHGEGKLRAHYQDDKAGAYYKDYNSTKDMKADIAKETKSKTTDLVTTKKAGIRSARRKTPTEATIKKPVATGKGSLRQTDNSEMRRRMWGTPGVPGKEKPTLDIRGKRRSSYDIPQRRAFAGKPIEESYIKYIMKEYGYGRADAIRLIKDKREGK